MKIVLQNILRDKKRTITILAAVILMVSAMSSLGNLFYGIRNCQSEYARSCNGYYEYSYRGKRENLELIRDDSCEIGATQFIATTEVPIPIQLQACNQDFLRMNKMNLIKGKMPTNQQEIIVEEWVLQNLGTDMDIGHTIIFDGKQYMIVGLLSDSFYKNKKEMNVFTTFFTEAECEYYLQFHKKNNLQNQMNEFKNTYSIADSKIRANWEVLESEGVKVPLGKHNSNFRGLMSRCVVDEYDLVIVWSFFSVFMIYSIYYLSIYKREKDYGVLKALGCSKGRLFLIIFLELFILYLIGFIIGNILGNIFTDKVYYRFMEIFLNSNISIVDFQVNLDVVKLGFTLMGILLIIVTFIIVKKIYKLNTAELIRQKETRLLKKRRILSEKHNYLIYSIMYRFITIRKVTLILLIVSLSFGGVIFLTSQYVLEQIKEQNILKIKSDLGSGMDYRVYIGNTDLLNGISTNNVEEMEKIEGISEIHPYNYTLGAVVLNDKQYPNEDYFAPENEDRRLLDMTGGICTKQSDGTFLLRTNLWGYDSQMLDSLQEFIIDGKIVPEEIETGQKAVVRLSMDGGGGYDNICIKPGDKIKVKVPRMENYENEDIFKFKNDRYYNTVEIEVAATVKAVSTHNEYFIDDSGIDIVTGNDAFKKITGIDCYNQIELKKISGENEEKITKRLADIVSDIKSGYFINHIFEIEQEEKNYDQKIFIFSLMSMAIMIMSFLYVVNSTKYITYIWKKELKIMRALGLSNRDLHKLMVMTAVFYGVLSLVLIYAGTMISTGVSFWILKNILFFYKARYIINWNYMLIFGIVNVLVCVVIMVTAGKKAIKNK